MTAPRIAVADIETAPLLAQVWGLFDQNIGLEQVVQDWYILGFGWKWLGDSEITYRDQRSAPDIENDLELLKVVRDLLDEADIVVAHNGKKFDSRKITARLIEADLEVPSPYRIIDTLQEVRKVAAFTSNKLGWLAKKLTPETPKLEHAKFPGHKLWRECLRGNPEAWAEMRIYNLADVVAAEGLYLRLRPWMRTHPNVAVYMLPDGDEQERCTRCGSPSIVRQGFRATQTGRYQRHRCNNCGGWSHSRLMIKEDRTHLLGN